MKARFDVVVLGGINYDFIIRGQKLPKPGETVTGVGFYEGPGGKAANQAVAASRLGARVALIGAVGNDSRGRELIQGLRREKVDVRKISRKEAQTGAAVISVEASGEKQITAALGANLKLTIQDVRQARAYLENCQVFLTQFEAPMKCVIAAARIARNAGAIVVLDPAPAQRIPRELAKLVDVIRPNASEAETLTGIRVTSRKSAREAGRKLLAMGPRLVCLEAGGKGDLLLGCGEEIFLPRLKVKSVDATGAGDAFAAGLAVGLAENLPVREAGMLANATAALATTKVGAQEGMPVRSEVTRLQRSCK